MPYTEDGYIDGDGWVAGIDFDPFDADEMEVMHAVWEQEKFDHTRQLERENESLRAALADRMTDEQRDEVEAALDAGGNYANVVCDVFNANRDL